MHHIIIKICITELLEKMTVFQKNDSVFFVSSKTFETLNCTVLKRVEESFIFI